MSDKAQSIAGLRRLAAAGRLSHAYLITGPEGSGKHEVALTLAQALVCREADKPCGQCPHCRKAAAGIHPDVITLSPLDGKRDILVDQVRELRADVYVRPNEAERKVYLVDPASALNANAQNALLKVLEEGPAYAVFLLLAESAGLLLPTIRSRCEQLALSPAQAGRTAVGPESEELARVLLDGGEASLLAKCVGLEKLDRESFLSLLDGTVEALRQTLRERPDRRRAALDKIELLKTLRAAGEFNVGVGHLAGWLCAGSF